MQRVCGQNAGATTVSALSTTTSCTGATWFPWSVWHVRSVAPELMEEALHVVVSVFEPLGLNDPRLAEQCIQLVDPAH